MHRFNHTKRQSNPVAQRVTNPAGDLDLPLLQHVPYTEACPMEKWDDSGVAHGTPMVVKTPEILCDYSHDLRKIWPVKI